MWSNLKKKCEDIEMGSGRDKVEWTLTSDKKIFVKFLYIKMVAEDCNFPQKNCEK